MEYNLAEPWKTLDPWQEEVLKTEGNLAVRKGRQVGASTVVSIKAGKYACENSNKSIIIVAKVERQALLLFEKVLGYVHARFRYMIKGRPTRHKMELKNGSTILCVPTGDSGYGIRGHTVNLLIVDEAAFVAREVYDAIVPMLAVTKGTMWLLSSPQGREGYFYKAFQNPKFKTFHISYLDCPRKDEEFIKYCKETMSKGVFAQEILGEFVDKLRRVFSDEWINNVCKLKRPEKIEKHGEYFCGVDVARLGGDESTFEIIRIIGKKLYQVENVITTKQYTTYTRNMIIELNRKYNFKKIYIDARGVGAGVLDMLLENEETRRKVTDIDNLKKDLNHEKTMRRKMNKEILYMNLLRLGEESRLFLLNDDEIRASLRSIQYDYTDKGTKIHGNYAHIVEGLTRAAWSIKDKSLNIFIDYI